jgi:hypothetical protein
MTHPAENHNDEMPASDPTAAMTPADDNDPAPQDEQPGAWQPASETVAAQTAAPQPEVLAVPLRHLEALEKNFERQAEDSFRMAVGSSTQTMAGFYEATTDAYETASQALRASTQEFATGLAQLNWKLLEFGRLNAQSNFDFVQSISRARTVRDLVDLQTAYMRGQYDALNNQFRELQTLTAALAGKTAAPLKEQLTRATQLPRIC